MSEPTQDTPQERDSKAEILAQELKEFRTETRRFYMVVLIFLAISTMWEHAW